MHKIITLYTGKFAGILYFLNFNLKTHLKMKLFIICMFPWRFNNQLWMSNCNLTSAYFKLSNVIFYLDFNNKFKAVYLHNNSSSSLTAY